MCTAPLQDENLHLSIWQLAHTGRGLGTIISLVVSLLGFAPFLYIEVPLCSVTTSCCGVRTFVSEWGKLSVSNPCAGVTRKPAGLLVL
jgi:hypothetical protein